MEVTYNMDYRRIHPHPSLSSPPSHTHTYTNSILLDSWSISRDNTTPLFSLCVHRDVLTIPLGSLCVHRDAPSDNHPIKIFPQPSPGWYRADHALPESREFDFSKLKWRRTKDRFRSGNMNLSSTRQAQGLDCYSVGCAVVWLRSSGWSAQSGGVV